MTKKYETYYRGDLKNFDLFKISIKGELTIVISKKVEDELPTSNLGYLEKQVTKYMKSYTVRDVVELISKKEDVPKKIIYNLCLKNKNE